MRYFCAHAIFYYKLIRREQNSFLVHENVYLICAETIQTAEASASKQAETVADLNNSHGNLELNEEKVSYLFAGIRKVIEVYTTTDKQVWQEISGLELSCSQFEVDTFEDVSALAQGLEVDVIYLD